MASNQIFKIVPLTSSEISFLQGLAPAVKEVGVKVTSTMYQYMFRTYPEVRSYFNMTNQHTGRQPKVLAFSLYQYILHLNDLTPISGFVKQIVIKHCGLGIAPEQYSVVGACLVHAFQEVLGPETADEHFVNVLTKAYGNLAQTLINAEESMYQDLQWRGFKDFKVVRLEKEAEDVTSVFLTPVDNTKLQPIVPGQYISLRWDVQDDTVHPREYSISHDLINNEYRISVRKLVNGKVSTFVNTKLQVGNTVPVHAPVGNMTYDATSGKPKVAVLAGGIGITPMITIMQAALNNGQSVELYYSNRTVDTEPFKKTFDGWVSEYPDSFELKDYVSSEGGKLTVSELIHIVPTEYDVYLLGPVGYMHEFKTYLTSKGVSDLKMEFFGPTDPDV